MITTAPAPASDPATRPSRAGRRHGQGPCPLNSGTAWYQAWPAVMPGGRAAAPEPAGAAVLVSCLSRRVRAVRAC